MNTILTKISWRKFFILLMLLTIAAPLVAFAIGAFSSVYSEASQSYNQFWLGTPSLTPSPVPQATWIPTDMSTPQNPDYDWPQTIHTGSPWYDWCGDRIYVIELKETNPSWVVIEMGFTGFSFPEKVDAPNEFDTMCHHVIIREDPTSNWLLIISRR